VNWVEEQLSGPYGYLKYQIVYGAVVILSGLAYVWYLRWASKKDGFDNNRIQPSVQTVKSPGGETLVVLPLRQYEALVEAAENSRQTEG
jgi:hypothetical protein